MKIVQLCPLPAGWSARFADPEAVAVDVLPLACLALIENENGSREVAGVCLTLGGEGFYVAEDIEAFDCYAAPQRPDPQ